MPKKPSPAKQPAPITPREYAINLAAREARDAEASIRKGCGHALVCGLNLLWVHRDIVNDSQANLLRGNDAGEIEGGEGFLVHLQSVALPKPTAYRWINAAAAALQRVDADPEDLPEPGTDEWESLCEQLRAVGLGMSIRRLQLGMVKDGTEEARLDELIDRAEQDDQHAIAALDAVAEGKATLVQAMRAAAGAASTKGKHRRDPVYLDIDGRSGALRGLLPKCIITLNNAFHKWPDLPEPARRKFRQAWAELAVNIPDELV